MEEVKAPAQQSASTTKRQHNQAPAQPSAVYDRFEAKCCFKREPNVSCCYRLGAQTMLRRK
jgi:hypothetical protein